MRYDKFSVLILVVSVVSFSCESPTSTSGANLLFYPTKAAYHIDESSAHPLLITTFIINSYPDTVEFLIECWDWQSVQVFQDSTWVDAFPETWNIDCADRTLTLLPFKNTNIGFALWPDFPFSSGLYRFAIWYHRSGESGWSELYSAGFTLTR